MKLNILLFKKWIILFTISCLYSPIIYGKETKEILYVGSSYPPWRIIEDDIISGINTELLKAVFSPLNIKMKFLVAPWKRCLKEMESGKADIMTGVLYKKKREEYMYFIQPPYKKKSNTATYVLTGQKLIRKYKDLYEKKIGVVRGAKYFDSFDTDEKINKELSSSNDLNFKKLLGKRVDVIISQEVVGDYIIATGNYENKIIKSPYIYEKPKNVYFAISKKSPLMHKIKEIETIVKKLTQKNKFEEIITNFLNQLRSKTNIKK